MNKLCMAQTNDDYRGSRHRKQKTYTIHISIHCWFSQQHQLWPLWLFLARNRSTVVAVVFSVLLLLLLIQTAIQDYVMRHNVCKL